MITFIFWNQFIKRYEGKRDHTRSQIESSEFYNFFALHLDVNFQSINDFLISSFMFGYKDVFPI